MKAVKRGQAGAAGELKGKFDLTTDLGTLRANTASGIFGELRVRCALTEGDAVPVAESAEVRDGPAVIRSNVAGDCVKDYQVELRRLGDGEERNLLVTVTDPELLSATGGIVQGMVVSYNRDNSGEKPLRRKALRACRIGAPVRCRRGQYGTTPFLQTG